MYWDCTPFHKWSLARLQQQQLHTTIITNIFFDVFLINLNQNLQTFKCFPITGTSNSRYEDIALLMLKQTINVHFAHRFSSDGNFFQAKHLYY